jgi:DNA-directed RNA polymerase beta' subunit
MSAIKKAMFNLLKNIQQPVKQTEGDVVPSTALPVPTLKEVRRENAGLGEDEKLAPAQAPVVGGRERKKISHAIARERAAMNKYDIGAVEFSFMSNETIRKLSVVRCTSADAEGVFTVNSSRMGSVERNTECQTCNLPELDCPGHMGRIDFPVPLPHPLALEYIVNTLQSVCRNCGRLLLPQVSRTDPSILRFRGPARLRKIAALVSSSNTITCPRNLELAARNRARDSARDGETIPDPPIVDLSDIKPPQLGTFEALKAAAKDPDLRATIGSTLFSEASAQGARIGDASDPDSVQQFCPSTIPTYAGPRKSAVTDWQITATIKSKTGKDRPAQRVSLEYIQRIFDAIPEEDLTIMGFSGDSHPRNFIMRSFPVIPPNIRPPLERDGDRKYDHLTVVYRYIIKDVINLTAAIEKNQSGVRDCENEISKITGELFFHVSHFMSNSDGQLKIRRDDVANTVASRLTGKSGFCRGTAQGKRSNDTARSVIGPGIMPFGAVLIPAATRVITIPERVTFINIDRINEQVRRGEIIHLTRARGIHAGITWLMPKRIADARAAGEEIPMVEIGDLVERLSGVGDDIIINRQPTLHRHSMIGVSAIPRLGQKTIKLHMSYTSPANATNNLCVQQEA